MTRTRRPQFTLVIVSDPARRGLRVVQVTSIRVHWRWAPDEPESSTRKKAVYLRSSCRPDPDHKGAVLSGTAAEMGNCAGASTSAATAELTRRAFPAAATLTGTDRGPCRPLPVTLTLGGQVPVRCHLTQGGFANPRGYNLKLKIRGN